MRWMTHQTGAVLGGLVFQLPVAAMGMLFMGAIAPDLVDQRISRLAPGRKKRQAAFNRIHRGASHWFGWWLGLFLLSLYVPLPELGRDICAGLAFGALSHVALDLFTPRGVPLFPFIYQPHVSLPICSTGKAGEYVFLLFSSLLVCLYVWLKGQNIM